MTGSHPGRVFLLSSGETSPSGGQIFERAVRQLADPPRIAILETPAGFELNSPLVAGRVVDFLRRRLQNYSPEIDLIPARKRNTAFSPDNAELIQPLLSANLIYAGAGSPTYAVRQLHDSLAWQTMIARHRLGATLVLASAATTAIGAHALPVYEIYKAGEDLHWRPGLDLFGAFGLDLVFIPHWNNAEGGADLDTSRCFMGETRFAELLALLPAHITVVGIDEHTALMMDFETAQAEVIGHGTVTVLQSDRAQQFGARQTFPLATLGSLRQPEFASGIPAQVWEEVLATQPRASDITPTIPDDVLALATQRQAARARREWVTADELRQRIAALGWKVLDTPDGTHLEPMPR